MKRVIAIVLSLACLCLTTGASWQVMLTGSVAPSTRTTYFGNCNSDGSPPTLAGTSFYGAILFHGTQAASPSTAQKAMEFTCPGTGPQTLNSMEMYAYQRAAGGQIRMAIYSYESAADDGGTIYNYSLKKIAEHSAMIPVNAGTSGAPQWFGSAQGLTGTTTLIGGQRYIVATAMDSANVGYTYTTSTNNISQLSGNYTSTGLPDPLTGSSVNNSVAHVVRLSITGDGTTAPAATQETFYVDTDYAGGGSDGSPTKPYINLQTAIVARCNKTFTKPIYIYCVGATADTLAVKDGALGQMVPSASNPLYIIGNRTLATWDTSKYRLEPTDRTSYYGAINIVHNYVYMDKLQVYLPSTTASVSNEIVYLSSTVPGSITFSHGIVRAPGGSDGTRYFSSSSGTGGIDVWNTLMYGMGTNITGNGIKNHGTSNIYNCVIIANAADAIDNTDNSTITVKNSYLQSTYSSGTIVNGTNATVNLVTVATSDADGSSGLQNIAYSTANFTNVTAGSEDLSLPVGSALIGVGTDTSGDSAPFNFTTDLIGATRTAPWDIGALKY